MNIKEMPLGRIMPYSEMISAMIEEMSLFGGEATMCCDYGGITEKEKEDIHHSLGLKMAKLEETRIKLVKEINRRMRKELGIGFGPSDITPYFNRIIKKHPLLGKGSSEIKAILEKKAQEKKLKKA